jgi:hypothetical protein
MNELLHEIYKILTALGIAKSGNQFSRELLGRSDRLYSWILATGRAPALDVMLGLYLRLDDLCENAQKDGDANRAKILDGLTTRLWDTIREESLAKGPNRRKKPQNTDGVWEGTSHPRTGAPAMPAPVDTNHSILA